MLTLMLQQIIADGVIQASVALLCYQLLLQQLHYARQTWQARAAPRRSACGKPHLVTKLSSLSLTVLSSG